MESRDEKDLEKAVKLVKNRRAAIECVEGKEKWRERERERERGLYERIAKEEKKGQIEEIFSWSKNWNNECDLFFPIKN